MPGDMEGAGQLVPLAGMVVQVEVVDMERVLVEPQVKEMLEGQVAQGQSPTTEVVGEALVVLDQQEKTQEHRQAEQAFHIPLQVQV